jgi:hypothetical protein
VRACVRAGVRACARVRARVCVCVCVVFKMFFYVVRRLDIHCFLSSHWPSFRFQVQKVIIKNFININYTYVTCPFFEVRFHSL